MDNSTIYILDDEEMLVTLQCEVAELAGFNVQGYTSAKDFFNSVTAFENHSLMVLDLHMPEVDGIEVMRQLTTMPNPPELILVSGHDARVLHSAEKLCIAHGLEVIACLSKPLSYKKLLQLFEQHIPITNKSRFISPSLNENAITSKDLELAIQSNQLTLHFQPQIKMTTGELFGVEALLRWFHPEQGLISPGYLLPLAESSGLMGKLTHWIINRTVEQEREWRNAGLITSVSVNISASDITSLLLPEQITGLLASNEFDHNWLTLEVTETALMGELVTSLDILTRLRLKGVKLSIDDFGTGYSSLSQLHRIPFSELKIDQTFISKMTEDKEALAIVKTCIVLGHELNMHIVAEGIETREHFDLVKQMGCDYAQGYFIAKPMPGDELIVWNESRKLFPDNKDQSNR